MLRYLAENPVLTKAFTYKAPQFSRKPQCLEEEKGSDDILLDDLVEYRGEKNLLHEFTWHLRRILKIPKLQLGAMRKFRARYKMHLIGLPITWREDRAASEQSIYTLRAAVERAKINKISAVSIASYDPIHKARE